MILLPLPSLHRGLWQSTGPLWWDTNWLRAAGVLISILGTVIPPFVILSLISVCYQAFRENWLVSHMLEGMQAGVGAVIASVTYEMGAGVLKEKDFLSVWILAGAFFASVFLEINVVWIVLVCAGIGVLRTLAGRRKKA